MFSLTVTRRIVRAADALEAWLNQYAGVILACLIVLALVMLQGCASKPIADRGTVLLTWEIGSVPGLHCGYAREIARGHYLVTFRRAYSFDDPCVIHELTHVFGGDHP